MIVTPENSMKLYWEMVENPQNARAHLLGKINMLIYSLHELPPVSRAHGEKTSTIRKRSPRSH